MSFLEKIGLAKQPKEAAAAKETNLVPEKIKSSEKSEKVKDIPAMPGPEDFKAILDQEGDLSIEELTAMTGVSPTEFLRALTAEENITINDIKEFNDILKTSIAETEDKYEEKGFRKLANNKFLKPAVLSLILFLKFAPMAEAASDKKPDSNANRANTETPAKADIKSNDGNTYYFGDAGPDSGTHYDKGSDANHSPEDLAKLDLTDSYETDKADIPASEQAAIMDKVDSFLNKIDAGNYKSFISDAWEISGSSDERPTSTWEGGNEELTMARIAAAENIIKEAINNHDYSGSGLAPEQITALKDKGFSYDIPISANGPEKGVTYLTDLKNPDTGENYTLAEIQEMKKSDDKKYYSLLQECRYIKVNLMAEQSKDKAPISGATEIQLNQELEDLNAKLDISGYKGIIILLDNSASMKVSKDALAEYMTNNQHDDIKVTTAIFSNRLGDFKPYQDMKTAIESLRQMDNSGNSGERTISCAIDALRMADVQENPGDGLALIGTDEALQGFSYNDLMTLQNLGQEKNIDINFLLAHNDKNGVRTTEKVALSEVINNFTHPDGMFEKTKARLEKYSKSDNVSRKSRKAFNERLAGIYDAKFTMKELSIDNGQGGESKIEMSIY